MKSKLNTKLIVIIAILGALSFVLTFITIPTGTFLKYDPSDIIGVTGGLMLGPVGAIGISIVKTILYIVSGRNISGIIGALIMLISSLTITLFTIIPYRIKKTNKSLILGIIVGTLATTITLCVLNYFVFLPLWGITSSSVRLTWMATLIPFNLIKAFIATFLGSLIFLFTKERTGRFFN